MKYSQAIKYLQKLEMFGIRLGLADMKRVLAVLGSPQKSLKVVHVGGTNGKGSTVAFISDVLIEAGYKVATYTSPHMVDFRERIQVNGKYIPKSRVCRLLGRIRRAVGNKPLTYFECVTVMALMYFAECGVDVAVLEVGMGGRLDATNVIGKSLVSVITNIDFEHTQYLGNTIAKIAYEKAGIIKKNSVVVTAIKKKQALVTIKDICRDRKTKLFRIGRNFKSFNYKILPRGKQGFDYRGVWDTFKGIKLTMKGAHQVDNALCALAAIEVLRQKGYRIEYPHISKGLLNTIWPGRIELKKVTLGVRKKVNVLLDGAHNQAGIKSLKNFLKSGIVKYNTLIIVFGVLADKDTSAMLRCLMPLAHRVILTKPKSNRAAEPEKIRSYIKNRELLQKVSINDTVQGALKDAFLSAKRDSLVCVTGSLYVVSEASQIM
ncbi:MAG: folylpolyglutamate synthase/dihydrofolate synthase family protein [bacterium]